MVKGEIVKVSGPLVVAEGLPGVKMYEVMRVGTPGLIGEVIELKENRVSIQVYEETAGLGPGEPVVATGGPLSVELGPGLISSIYDGIQRPLDKIREKVGSYITRGIHIPGIDREKQWTFRPKVKKGDRVISGDIIGEVEETTIITHRIMVPPEIEGEVVEIHKGEFTVEEIIARIQPPASRSIISLSMLQRWPVRRQRPYKEKLPSAIPLFTGTRVIDTFFPITKGGTACIPGPFGSGKTVVLHQLAKWADADIIIYVGCGERGNEMCDVLLELPKLKDPRTGESLMKRTVLIANTSNMPVAAREASVYTGATIGEYFRDMGYKVAIMADSTSRWAEAMREMSGRLEEMPGEEGYPAYLAARVAEFYERSGRVICQGQDGREGTLSIMGAVSPPGGDLSDPVVQATLRMVKVFWSLEDRLAYQRHFPAIDWLNSYSLYLDNIEEYLSREVAKDYLQLRSEAMRLLQEEASLEELVRLVGLEAISAQDRLILETAKSIREDFLHQHAFDPQDSYTGAKKQYRMLRVIIRLYRLSQELLDEGVEFSELQKLKVKERISRMKYIPEGEEEKFGVIEEEMKKEIEAGREKKG